MLRRIQTTPHKWTTKMHLPMGKINGEPDNVKKCWHQAINYNRHTHTHKPSEISFAIRHDLAAKWCSFSVGWFFLLAPVSSETFILRSDWFLKERCSFFIVFTFWQPLAWKLMDYSEIMWWLDVSNFATCAVTYLAFFYDNMNVYSVHARDEEREREGRREKKIEC